MGHGYSSGSIDLIVVSHGRAARYTVSDCHPCAIVQLNLDGERRTSWAQAMSETSVISP